MSKNRKHAAAATGQGAGDVEVFTFGEPEAVLERRWLLDYLSCASNGRWFEPPVSFAELGKTFRAAVHHSSPIYFKRNLLIEMFEPSRLLSRAAFGAYVLDFLIYGNGYLRRIDNRLGAPLRLEHMPSLYTRRAEDLVDFWFVARTPTGAIDEQRFAGASVFQLKEYDSEQEVYGLPEYLAALNSALLNEAATVFRRRYFKNGSHAGFILYLTDAKLSDVDADALRNKLRQSKGVGNFQNLFLHAPGGDKDGVKLIPVGEVAAKDEFSNIKSATRDDVLAAHRVPPQLLGILPNNTGGFGDVEKAARSFYFNEIQPLQRQLAAVNDWLGVEVVKFGPYKLLDSLAASSTPPAS
ncbi:MAG: phage portal protein [Betaproteobacteria bacterium]|nr:phage portal protein [Betaproteobacteria bacterium]